MIKELFAAASAYGTALKLTSQYRLWGYFLAPALISILLGAGVFYGAWSVSDDIAHWLINWYPWEWGKSVVEGIVQAFGGLLVAALGIILFKALVIALASPFMSFLSEKIERKLYGGESPSVSVPQMLSDLVRGIRIAIRLVVGELSLTLLLFMIGLIPIFSPFVPVALFIVQAYFAGFGNMDFTLERYFRVKGSVRFVRRHRGLALGNGAVYLFLYFTVIGFLVALPLGTIAAAVETLKAVKKEEGLLN